MHNVSEMKAIFDSGATSIQSFPVRTTGQDFLHSCLHFLGLHLSVSTMAILATSAHRDVIDGEHRTYRVKPLAGSSTFLAILTNRLVLKEKCKGEQKRPVVRLR